MLLAAGASYAEGGYSWLRFALLLLAPDMSALGYLFGPRIGAVAYNLAHTYTAVAACWLGGHFLQLPSATPLALIWLAHIGMDRLVGYGLKYPTAFKETHLGRV